MQDFQQDMVVYLRESNNGFRNMASTDVERGQRKQWLVQVHKCIKPQDVNVLCRSAIECLPKKTSLLGYIPKKETSVFPR